MFSEIPVVNPVAMNNPSPPPMKDSNKDSPRTMIKIRLD